MILLPKLPTAPQVLANAKNLFLFLKGLRPPCYTIHNTGIRIHYYNSLQYIHYISVIKNTDTYF